MFRNRIARAMALVCLSICSGAFAADEAFFEAARAGDAAALKAALDAGTDVNARTEHGATALLFAARNGRLDAVKLLVERGADLNARDAFYGMNVLGSAADAGHAEIVRLLLEKNAQGAGLAISAAVRGGKPDVVRAILDLGKLNRPQLSAGLRTANQLGQTEIAAMLEAAGASAGSSGPFQLDAETLAALPGSYRSWRGEVWKLEAADGKVLLRAGDAAPVELVALDKTFFKRADDEAARVLISLGEDGKAAALTLMKAKADPLIFVREDLLARADPAPASAAPAGKVAAPANWPQFRGAGASGVADGQFPPAVWNAATGENIAWKTPIPGLGHSSPVIWGERVFVTTAISGKPDAYFRHGLYGDVDMVDDLTPHEFRVICLDKKSGKILWNELAFKGPPREKRHMKSTHANSTPATDGKRLVVTFGSQGTYCYDLGGKLLWKADLGPLDSGWFYDPGVQWGFASSPIIYKNLVILQCDVQKNAFIAALDLETGKEVWRTKRDEIPSWGTPTVVESGGKEELVANGTHAIRGYDPLTGAEIWKLSPNSEVTAPTPVFAEGLIYVTSGYRPVQPIYAIRAGSEGEISLKEGEEANDSIAWSTKRDGPYMPTPLVYGGRLYTCANQGVLTCYEAKTGKRLWRSRLGHMGGGYSGSPVAADGRIYFPSEDGDVHVIAAGDEYKLLASNPLGEILMASPAISDGMIFVRSVSSLFGIGTRRD